MFDSAGDEKMVIVFVGLERGSRKEKRGADYGDGGLAVVIVVEVTAASCRRGREEEIQRELADAVLFFFFFYRTSFSDCESMCVCI